MSAAVAAMIKKAVKLVGPKKDPGYPVFQLRSKEWDSVSKAMVKVLDEAKGHGVSKPLGKLQELAYTMSLEESENRQLQIVALWLTDSRIWLERYLDTKDDALRDLLEHRGLLKKKAV